MKTTVNIIIGFLIIFCSESLLSQTDDLLWELPGNTKEDFIKSEPKLFNTIDWLDNTPVDKDIENRKKQMTILLAWLTNSPTVSIEVNHDVLPFIKKNPELLMTFLGGWTKYSIENSYSNDIVKCNLAGIKSVIAFYKKGSGLKKDKAIEELIKLDNKNELENWIKDKLNKK